MTSAIVLAVRGAAWKLLENMYSDINSCVKLNGSVSAPIKELQGIRQGGASSADCYKAGKNKLLHHLDSNPSAKTGSINAGAVMVAYDLALISSLTHPMQVSLDVAQTDAMRERYKFNTTKTKTVSVNCNIPPVLLLNSNPLGSSPSETHVGIARTANNTNIESVKNRLKCTRQTSYSLMGAGLHRLNGTGPMVAMIQYNTYVLPTLLYREALVLHADEIQPLDKFHRQCLHYIQHLPQSTANLFPPTWRSPQRGTDTHQGTELLQENHWWRKKSSPSEYMRDIIIKQLAMKEDESSSWVAMVKKLLRIYGLPSAYTLLENTPTKSQCTVEEDLKWSSMESQAKGTLGGQQDVHHGIPKYWCMPSWKVASSLEKHHIPIWHPEGNCQSPALSKTVSSLYIKDSWKKMEQHLPIVWNWTWNHGPLSIMVQQAQQHPATVLTKTQGRLWSTPWWDY